MGNFYSYMKISTDTEKQNFNRQKKSLSRYAKDHDIEYLVEFSEEKSAKNFTERVQFQKLDKILQKDDTVVFKDISRFTREAENGYKKYMEWLERGISIVFLEIHSKNILRLLIQRRHYNVFKTINYVKILLKTGALLCFLKQITDLNCNLLNSY